MELISNNSVIHYLFLEEEKRIKERKNVEISEAHTKVINDLYDSG